jgi:hypothetical protein
MDDDRGTLLNAMEGDEEEEYEFRMMFSDLSGRVGALNWALSDNKVNEYFDDFLVGILGNRYRTVGWDGFQEDYYGLTGFESELAVTASGNRLMKLTKETLLSIAGQCIGIVISFLDVRHQYDYLKASFDILKDQNTAILETITAVSEAYEAAAAEAFRPYSEQTKRFTALLDTIPEREWI